MNVNFIETSEYYFFNQKGSQNFTKLQEIIKNSFQISTGTHFGKIGIPYDVKLPYEKRPILQSYKLNSFQKSKLKLSFLNIKNCILTIEFNTFCVKYHPLLQYSESKSYLLKKEHYY